MGSNTYSARRLFDEPRFDPLGIDPTSHRARLAAISVYVGVIILSIAESVSSSGVLVNLN